MSKEESKKENKRRCILDKVVMATLFKQKVGRERERKEKKKMIMKSILVLTSFTLYVTLHASFFLKLRNEKYNN
jgi:hypothetical protein